MDTNRSVSLQHLRNDQLSDSSDTTCRPIRDFIKLEEDIKIKVELDVDCEHRFQNRATPNITSELLNYRGTFEQFQKTAAKSMRENGSLVQNMPKCIPAADKHHSITKEPLVACVQSNSGRVHYITNQESMLKSEVDWLKHSIDLQHAPTVYAEQNSKVKHIKPQHVKKLFNCEICKYSTSAKRNLVEHIRTHTGERPYKCEICNYSATVKCNLLQHIKSHTGDRPYKCEMCNYSSLRKLTLLNHHKTHTRERPFKCELCDYSSSEKRTLVQHMRTHSGEKPFKCEICDYSAAIKPTLVRHTRTHTGERPFKCELCDYSCARKSHLILHIKTHTGKTPIKCELCGYSTFAQQRFVQHMQTHW